MFTAYELMQRRFGPRVRKVASGIFLVTRALAEGVRVFAISIVVSIILQTGGPASIAVIMVLTLFYTFEGGMTAVIWTDVVQMCMYVVGRGGQLLRADRQDSRADWGTRWISRRRRGNCRFSISTGPGRILIPSGRAFVGGCFLTTASHGTDQLVVQRLLSAKNQSAEPRWRCFPAGS